MKKKKKITRKELERLRTIITLIVCSTMTAMGMVIAYGYDEIPRWMSAAAFFWLFYQTMDVSAAAERSIQKRRPHVGW